jgi:hypothetical protein
MNTSSATAAAWLSSPTSSGPVPTVIRRSPNTLANASSTGSPARFPNPPTPPSTIWNPCITETRELAVPIPRSSWPCR